jgi:signal transduction histidine kinase
VSHELRTPLNVILGYVEMLGDGVAGDLSQEQQALLREVERYSRLQLDLITNVLDFSRLSSGRISLHVERFALPPLLDEVQAVYGPRTAAAGLTLEVGTDPHLPLLETDRIKVQEILRNLDDNAVKFTTTGTVSVRAIAGRDPDWVLLEIADTGPGIPEADADVVFEAFRQRGASSTRGTNGVGLGLSIVRQLAEALGGRVTLASRVGFGSTFSVALPVRAPDGDLPASEPATPAADMAADAIHITTEPRTTPARRQRAARRA